MDIRITFVYFALKVIKYYVHRSVLLLTLVVLRHYFGHFKMLISTTPTAR